MLGYPFPCQRPKKPTIPQSEAQKGGGGCAGRTGWWEGWAPGKKPRKKIELVDFLVHPEGDFVLFVALSELRDKFIIDTQKSKQDVLRPDTLWLPAQILCRCNDHTLYSGSHLQAVGSYLMYVTLMSPWVYALCKQKLGLKPLEEAPRGEHRWNTCPSVGDRI